MSVTVTTYRVTFFTPEDDQDYLSGNFESAEQALEYAEMYTDDHAVVEKVEITPLYALHQALKTTRIT